ncbi:ABC transporter ATP-binding protein [Streptomonospora wellingtoniae]|uniref:ABC transporter ATP-binding protein n=1 Tax=Streptomonospora wellingtoniae TaxID=3075544 RepID=A0ABU2KPY9_9ACTN|nr:ABC transporter ATP-binding protein [Streptomonospora sp. DSM 45055]MDT0301344.1 ABC transporter ATP-binding protein [Streptomonospora sp. DSM 45055]
MDVAITGLTKTFGRSTALHRLDLEFGTGMIGLLGPNGAGKTTLMRLLTGILRPSSGRIAVGGHDLGNRSGRASVKRMLGYLPQHLDLYPDLSAREFLDYIGLLKGVDDKRERRARCERLLDEVGLTDSAKRRLGEFSGGMKRRVGIAQALMADPRLVVVDEPTTGLDPEERMRFRSLLAGLGGQRTVVLSTHILDDVAQTCPRVAVLAAGRLVYDGSTSGLTASAEGRTYRVDTSGPQPAGGHSIANAAATGDGMRYRIVTEQPPAGAVPVAATLEDGYVALMRDARAPR